MKCWFVSECRKGILNPKRLAQTMGDCNIEITSDIEEQDLLMTPGSSQSKTKAGRASFRNVLTKRFGSKYGGVET